MSVLKQHQRWQEGRLMTCGEPARTCESSSSRSFYFFDFSLNRDKGQGVLDRVGLLSPLSPYLRSSFSSWSQCWIFGFVLQSHEWRPFPPPIDSKLLQLQFSSCPPPTVPTPLLVLPLSRIWIVWWSHGLEFWVMAGPQKHCSKICSEERISGVLA